MSDDAEKPRKPSMAKLRTQPLARNWALTRLGVSTGARIAMHSVGNLFRDDQARADGDREFYRARAQVLADELGQLKGSVMKAGQMLSLYGQYFLPPEAVEVLAGLQDDTPPVDWAVIRPVLERSLGRRLQELDIDETPLAAASLGQAHRARVKASGREIVLKVQYPGVADAIESDIRSLQRIVMMSRMAPAGLSMDSVFSEVREMLHREVDYGLEQRFTEEFAQRLAGDERYVVPATLPEYCADQVLATTFEAGLHVKHADVQDLPQAQRDRLAVNFLELFLREFLDWHTVQSDPHFGNYRLRINEAGEPQWVLLDFGATRVFNGGFVDDYSEMLWGALYGDAERIDAGAESIGLMHADFPEAVRASFHEIWALVLEPFARAGGAAPAALMDGQGRYDWGASDLPLRVTNKMARAAVSRYFRVPPREIVFLHRRLAGVFIMLATLKSRIQGREVLQGFAPPQ